MKRLLAGIVVFCLSLLAIRPLFSSGYFPMHDDTQIARVITMGRSLSEGQFPVRMVADLGFGYGYPIFNFYGPLPYYFGGILYALGVPALLATKLMFAAGIILPAITLYAVVSGMLGIPAAVVSSLLYIYAPYHAVQIYVRGAVGEYWTLLFWPLILYALAGEVNPRRAYRRVLIGAFGVAGAVLSHTLLGYVTVFFLVSGLLLHWLIRIMNRTFVASVFSEQASTVLLGLGLSVFFWLPALWEMGYTSVSGQVSDSANYRDHFVCIGQLWNSLWGYGGSAPGCLDGMSFILGKVHVIISLLSLFGWLWSKPKKGKAVMVVGVLITVTAVFLAIPQSAFIWQLLPGFAYLQYPWRFLALSAFGLSLLGGIGIRALRGSKRQAIAAALLSVGIVALNVKWFVPQYTYIARSDMFETPSDLRWRISKISDEYLPNDLIRPTRESEAVFDTIKGRTTLLVTKLKESAIDASFVLQAASPMDIVLYKAYFPGWRYFINTAEVIPKIEKGLPVVRVDAGQSLVEMRFTDTPVRTAANIISFAAFILCTVILYEQQRKAKR